jgi:hypothetical protein
MFNEAWARRDDLRESVTLLVIINHDLRFLVSGPACMIVLALCCFFLRGRMPAHLHLYTRQPLLAFVFAALAPLALLLAAR